MMYASMHPQGSIMVTTLCATGCAHVGLQLTDSTQPTEEFTIWQQTPESLIILGEAIKREGIRLANERDEQIPEPVHAWTAEEVLQHEA